MLVLGETVDGPLALGAAMILGGVLLFTRGREDTKGGGGSVIGMMEGNPSVHG